MSPPMKSILESTDLVAEEPPHMEQRGGSSSDQESEPSLSGALIINADDWGRDIQNTSRTLDCIEHGSVSSVSAMVFMEDSERAAAIARERGIDAGLHLNFTTSFSSDAVSTRLIELQQRLSHQLLSHRFSPVVFYPWLTKCFEYVAAAQLEEFQRLYGKTPARVDGHHHMHLCANVLLGKLLPEGAIVRRNFSFEPGEKSLGNHLYRRQVDRILGRRYRLVDRFFSIAPLEPFERLQRIFSYARQFVVEVETHPVNPDEYRFLLSGEVTHQSRDVPIASHFAVPKFKGALRESESSDISTRIEECGRPEVREEATQTSSHLDGLPLASDGCQKPRATILIGFAEAATAAEVAWSLIDSGYDVIAFARKGSSSALRHSRHVICHDICAPEIDLQTSLSDLRALIASIREHAASAQRVIFPLDDKAVFLCSKPQIGEGWTLAGPDGDNAELALNKFLQIQLADRAGFNVPETFLARSKNDIHSFITAESFPIILKSAHCVHLARGRASTSRHWICANERELGHALEEWEERGPLLVQPFIVGTGEGIFGLSASDGIRAWSAHRRLRMMNPQGSGSSACVSQSVPENLRSNAEEFIKHSGWRGLFMIELLRDQSGMVFFVEFNGRPWGSMALSRRQGLEYPAWQINLALDPDSQIGISASAAPGVLSRHLGRELMHLLFVLRGPKSLALSEWPSFWKSTIDVFRFRKKDTLYNWRRGDLRVFLADVAYTIKNNLIKTSR
jgi:chitin disaccharide deacetylase